MKPRKVHALWEPDPEEYIDEEEEDDPLPFTLCGLSLGSLYVASDPGIVDCGNCRRLLRISTPELRAIRQAKRDAYTRATSILRERYRREFEAIFRDEWVAVVNELTNSRHKDLNEVLFEILGYPA